MNKFPGTREMAGEILAMRQRAAKLGSNQKLDKYAWTERQPGELLHNSGRTNIPPAIRIVPIKPEWLCGTFAAHPMLGFRRDRQKRSIAHGCASTLLSFGDPALKNKLDCWRADADAAPCVSSWGEAFELAHEPSGPRGWQLLVAGPPLSLQSAHAQRPWTSQPAGA